MIAEVTCLKALLAKFWSIDDNRYSIVPKGVISLSLFELIILRAHASAGNKYYDGHCVFDFSEFFGKLVDVYFLYFDFPLATFCVNQEYCLILLIDNAMPDKG